MSSIKKNFLYQTSYQMLLMIMPLITAPYIARVLGAENSGIYSYTHIIANYFVIFAMLGLETYGNRVIARVRDDKELLNIRFSELLVLHVIVSCLVLVVYLIYVFMCNNEYKLLLLIQGIYVLSSIFDINWFFFGIEQYKITVTRNFLIKLITVLSIFCFVKTKDDLWLYCFIMAIGTFVSQLILWYFIPRHVSFKKIEIKAVIKHIKPLIVLFIAVIAAHIYRMIDKLMLGEFGLMTDLGCYEYADKFVRIPLSIITALGTVMVSRMSNLFAKDDSKQINKILSNSALFVIFMSCALAFGLAGIAPEFVFVFLGSEYEESALLIIILSSTIPLIAWNNFERTQLLIPLQLDKVYTKAVGYGALINVVLNLMLIYLFEARGAAIATIFSYLVVMIVQTKALIPKTDILKLFSHLPYPLISGIIMFIIIRIIGNFMGKTIISLILEIIIGGGVYIALSYMWLLRIDPNLLKAILNKRSKFS